MAKTRRQSQDDTNQKLFGVFNDVHFGDPVGHGASRATELFAHAESQDIPFAIINGDLLELGTTASASRVLPFTRQVLDQLSCPRYLAFGNHDNGPGNSVTDCNPTDVAAFFDAIGDSHTTNPDVLDDAKTLGYYHFMRDGIDYIVLNSVELQAPTEGDYGIRAEQRTWLTNTLAGITGTDRKLIVFSHVDPSSSGAAWYRLNTSDRTFIQNQLSAWNSTQGEVLGVISGHEHGLNNGGENRIRTVGGVQYFNLIDGVRPNGSTNIKSLTYDTGAINTYAIGVLNQNGQFELIAQRGGNSLAAPQAPVPPEFQVFNGVDEFRDTNIMPNATTEFEFDCRFRSVGNDFKAMGCTLGSSTRFYAGLFQGRWHLGYNTLQDTGIDGDTNRHVFRITPAGLSIDGVMVLANAGGSLVSPPAGSATRTINIGAHETQTATNPRNGFCDVDFYGATILHNGSETVFQPQ